MNTCDIVFRTPPMKIGRCEWSLIVYVNDGVLVTNYNFRDPAFRFSDGSFDPAGSWKMQREWQRYNFNDGTYGGLPKTLRKLYEKHEDTIEGILKTGELPLFLPLASGGKNKPA